MEADITSEVDNTDPSHRKIKFDVVLTNTGQETLKAVDVYVMNGPFTSRAVIGYTWRSKEDTGSPYTLGPLESVEYEITFMYDATNTSPEAVDEKIRSMFIDVHYLQDGRQRIETFQLETPDVVYTLSDEMPPASSR